MRRSANSIYIYRNIYTNNISYGTRLLGPIFISENGFRASDSLGGLSTVTDFYNDTHPRMILYVYRAISHISEAPGSVSFE